MSITEKAVTRFWQSMGERYGNRWFEAYGVKPTQAWRDCLQPFSPKDIHGAIEALALKDHTRQHPPTEPEFRMLLSQAVRRGATPSENPNDLRRGYWRSRIVTAIARGMGFSVDDFEPVLVANKHSLGRAMKDLLDEVDELETATGQRTRGQESMVDAKCADIVTAFRALKAAA